MKRKYEEKNEPRQSSRLKMDPFYKKIVDFAAQPIFNIIDAEQRELPNFMLNNKDKIMKNEKIIISEAKLVDYYNRLIKKLKELNKIDYSRFLNEHFIIMPESTTSGQTPHPITPLVSISQSILQHNLYRPVVYGPINENNDQEILAIKKYLAFIDTLKDFPKITDDLYNEIINDKDFNGLLTSIIDVLYADYIRNRDNDHVTNLKYYELLTYIININNHENLIRILKDYETIKNSGSTDTNRLFGAIDINQDKTAIFNRIFKPSNKKIKYYDLSKPTTEHIIDNIDTYERYEINLGPTDGPGIFANMKKIRRKAIVNKINQTEDDSKLNTECKKILEMIFGKDFNIILNAAFKTDDSIKKNVVNTVARAYDQSIVNLRNVLVDYDKKYFISKDENELNYLTKFEFSHNILSVKKKEENEEDNEEENEEIYTYQNYYSINLVNNKYILKSFIKSCKSLNKDNKDTTIKNIKKIINDCTTNAYNKYIKNTEEITPKIAENFREEAIKCILEILINEFLACVFPKIKSKSENENEISKIQLLTDLKRAGDFLTAQSALATGSVFGTTDYIAASYAILIGCKTLHCYKDREGNYIYNAYNPIQTGPATVTEILLDQQESDVEMEEQDAESIMASNEMDPYMMEQCVKNLEAYKEYLNEEWATPLQPGNAYKAENTELFPFTSEGGAIPQRLLKRIPLITEYLYEKSLDDKYNYLKVVYDAIKQRKSMKDIERLVSSLDEAGIRSYLDSVHLRRYGYSTPLQYVTLRFMELKGIIPSMQWLASIINKEIDERLKVSLRSKPATVAPLPSLRTGIAVHGGGAAVAKGYRARLERLKKKHERFVASGSNASSKEYAELYDKMSQLYLDVKGALGR